MMKTLPLLLIGTLCCWGSISAKGTDSLDYQAPRARQICQHHLSLGVLGASSYTSYLSRLTYRGVQAAIHYEGLRTLSTKLTQEWEIQMEGGGLLSPAKNRSLSADIHGHWGVFYPFLETPTLRLSVGGQAQFEAGGLYMPAYSNSILTPRVRADLNASFRLDYQFRCGKLPLVLHYRLALPVVGVCSAPDFGASYYEITFPNQVDKYAHASSWSNQFNFRTQVALDLVFKRGQLRLSYIGHSHFSTLKGIYSEVHSHGFFVGFVSRIVHIGGQRSQNAAYPINL